MAGQCKPQENHPRWQSVNGAWTTTHTTGNPLSPPPPYQTVPAPYVVPIPLEQSPSATQPPRTTTTSTRRTSATKDTLGNALSNRMRALYQMSQFMLAPSFILFGLGVVMALSPYRYQYDNGACARPGATIWAGSVGLVAAVVGQQAFGKDQTKHRRCLAMVFFVLIISIAISCGSLVVLGGRCVVKASHDAELVNALAHDKAMDNSTAGVSISHVVKTLTLVIILESAVALTALVNMISAMATGSIVCGTWCSGNTTAVTVIYIHPEAVPHIRRLAAAPANQENQIYFVSTGVAPTAPGLIK